LSADVDPLRSACLSVDLSGLRVLVVDDHVDTLDMMRVALELCGAAVVVSNSARERLQAIEQYGPDIVLSDLAMPEEDGFWLLGQVRSMQGQARGELPVIAVTAHARRYGYEEILRAGFDGLIRKPVDPVSLCDDVRGFVRRS